MRPEDDTLERLLQTQGWRKYYLASNPFQYVANPIDIRYHGRAARRHRRFRGFEHYTNARLYGVDVLRLLVDTLASLLLITTCKDHILEHCEIPSKTQPIARQANPGYVASCATVAVHALHGLHETRSLVDDFIR